MGKLPIYFITYFLIHIVLLLHCNTFVAQTVIPAHGKQSSLKLMQSVPTRTIEFAGMTWYVRNTNGAPGPNNWSDTTENVWVDSIGCLHLKIRKENNIWYCSEIYSQKLCSLGEYTFFTASNFDNYDSNIVAGFFVYQDDNHEIDIEFSKFGNINNYRGWYVNQPSTEESTHGFDLNLNGNYSTHKFIWSTDSIFFQSYHGHYPTLPSSNFLIEEWNYTGNNIPIPDNERIYINFWLFQGNAPVDQNEAELIITDFWPPNTKDFSISNTSLSTTSISPGEQLTASCEQQYTGNCQSVLNPKVGYYLSSDTQLDSSDVLLGESDSNLGPTKSSESESCVLTIPSNILPGNYYILFVADYQNLFEEKNEQNNISSLEITVIPPSYPITALPGPALGGTIEGAGIYVKGANCILSATPQTGYEFVNWTENSVVISDSSSINFTVNANRTLNANFRLQKFNILAGVNPTEAGNVTGTGEYEYENNATLSATPQTGYEFVNWTENSVVISDSSSINFTVNANRTLNANFRLQKFNILAGVNPAAAGNVTGTGEYEYGNNVTLSATPQAGYEFVNWTENAVAISDSSSINFTVNANRTLNANFRLQKFNILAGVNPAEAGNVTGTGEYEYGNNVTLSATPQAGYEFVNWTENENQIYQDSTFSFIVDHGRYLVANFQVKSSTQIKQGEINLTFFPNPTNGVLHIRNDFLNARSITIKVITINGTIVFIKNLQSKSDIELNFEFLNKGFYYIQVTNGNLIQTEKLIIN